MTARNKGRRCGALNADDRVEALNAFARVAAQPGNRSRIAIAAMYELAAEAQCHGAITLIGIAITTVVDTVATVTGTIVMNVTGVINAIGLSVANAEGPVADLSPSLIDHRINIQTSINNVMSCVHRTIFGHFSWTKEITSLKQSRSTQDDRQYESASGRYSTETLLRFVPRSDAV